MSRVVIVTGASSGIGLEASKMFYNAGDKVICMSRNAKGEFGDLVECDISSSESVKRAIDYVIEKYGRIDVLVNNAGMGISGAFETQDIEDIRKQFDVNLIGSIQMMQAVLPYMRKNGGGRIINTSSVASRVGIPFQSFYSASKSALDTVSFALQAEVKEFNIKITNVLPGDTKTGFTKNRIKQDESKADVYSSKMVRSVETMEKDEQNGMSPKDIAKTIYNVSLKKNPPLFVVVGFKYKMLTLGIKLLPVKLVNKVIGKMYVK